MSGSGYVGQNTYESGKQLSEYAYLNYPFSEKTALIFAVEGFTLNGEYTNRELRSLGIYDGLNNLGFEVDIITLPVTNQTALSSVTEELYSTYVYGKNYEVIFIDSGKFTDSFSRLMANNIVSPDKYVVAGFDLSPAIFDALEKGYVDYFLDQQPYLQGYLSLFNTYLSEKYGFSGLYIDTGVGIVTSDEVSGFKNLIDAQVR